MTGTGEGESTITAGEWRGHFDCAPVPDRPGWVTWTPSGTGFVGALYDSMTLKPDPVRPHVRFLPGPQHANLVDNVHGGALLGFLDCALFAGIHGMGVVSRPGSATVDLQCSIVSAGLIGLPMDAEVELVRETGRLIFLRGLVCQPVDEAESAMRTVASFSAIVRKHNPPKGAVA